MAHPDPEWVSTIFTTFLAGNAPSLDTGLGVAPENATYPYLVVTPLTPFLVEGGLDSINELQAVEWQVTSVAVTPTQALGGIAAARDRLLGAAEPDFSAAGYKKTGSVKIVPGPSFTSDQGDKPALYLSNETYRMTITPA